MQFDLLLAAGVDGGVRRRPRLLHGHGAGLLGFAAQGGKGGEERQQVERGLLILQGGSRREGSEGRHGSTASMAPVFSLAPQ